jgi:hypothetical protein
MQLRVLRLGVLAGAVYGVTALAASYGSLGRFYLTAIPAGVFGGIAMINGEHGAGQLYVAPVAFLRAVRPQVTCC